MAIQFGLVRCQIKTKYSHDHILNPKLLHNSIISWKQFYDFLVFPPNDREGAAEMYNCVTIIFNVCVNPYSLICHFK